MNRLIKKIINKSYLFKIKYKMEMAKLAYYMQGSGVPHKRQITPPIIIKNDFSCFLSPSRFNF